MTQNNLIESSACNSAQKFLVHLVLVTNALNLMYNKIE